MGSFSLEESKLLVKFNPFFFHQLTWTNIPCHINTIVFYRSHFDDHNETLLLLVDLSQSHAYFGRMLDSPTL